MGGQGSGRRPTVDSIRTLRRGFAKADGAPAMPHGLNKRAKEIWHSTLATAPKGLIKACDSHLLASYCTVVALHEQAAIQIERIGAIVRGAKAGVAVKSPWVSIFLQSGEALRSLADRLGLSPQARVGLPAGQDAERDPLEMLLGHNYEEDGTSLN